MKIEIMKITRLVFLFILLLIAATISVIVVFLKNPDEDSTPTLNNKDLNVEISGKDAQKANLIKVDSPIPNQLVKSPLTLKGEARGAWYFEADFPVYLYDANEALVAQGIALAQGEWMTEDFVPFSTTLTFENPETEQGTLVLEKSNPSGLPEQADEIIIPIRFN